jgi:hypothetical protein
MRKRSDKYKYKNFLFHSDIPKAKEGEVIIVPMDNRLLTNPPYLNKTNPPAWFRRLPRGRNSFRRCQGNYDYMSSGFTIPAWTNIHIRPSADGKDFDIKTESFDENISFQIQRFPFDMTGECPFTKDRELPKSDFPKLVSPWRYMTKKGTSLLALPILSEPDPRYTIVPGIVHSDYYHQIHIVLNIKSREEFMIPEGTPLQHMIPIKRDADIKTIVWGNQTLFELIRNSGSGKLLIKAKDAALFYRQRQREVDNEKDS